MPIVARISRRWTGKRILLLAASLSLCAVAAKAAPVVAPGYTLSVFAGPLAGSSAPDSIAIVGDRVFVGYGNGGAADGSGGATSTIAEYTSSGALVGTTTVVGHNDGLRFDRATGKLWALQNEDANPNLVLINPSTLAQSPALPFSSTPHGGGYDDVAFGPSGIFISASNPANNPNNEPAIVQVALQAAQVNVLGGVLQGVAGATVINPPGGTTTLNLQDPDSLIFAPDGRLVLDSQADHELVYVSNVGTPGQMVSVLNLPNEVDDTVFGNGTQEKLLFADRDSGTVYALSGAFVAGDAFSAADAINEIVAVDQSDGDMTQLVGGLSSPHGEAFLGVPEPSTWAMMLLGVAAIGLGLRRRSRHALTI